MKPILIVEDEAIMRESLEDWLKNSGYQVETAKEGDEAINFPRPYGRGFSLSQTSFALHLFYPDLQCMLLLSPHQYPPSRQNTLLTILHPFPNILVSGTGIFASTLVRFFALQYLPLSQLSSLAESIQVYECVHVPEQNGHHSGRNRPPYQSKTATPAGQVNVTG